MEPLREHDWQFAVCVFVTDPGEGQFVVSQREPVYGRSSASEESAASRARPCRAGCAAISECDSSAAGRVDAGDDHVLGCLSRVPQGVGAVVEPKPPHPVQRPGMKFAVNARSVDAVQLVRRIVDDGRAGSSARARRHDEHRERNDCASQEPSHTFPPSSGGRSVPPSTHTTGPVAALAAAGFGLDRALSSFDHCSSSPGSAIRQVDTEFRSVNQRV